MSPIAIIGIGCRFPGGASSPEKYWELLHSGTDAISDVPPDRWNLRAFYHPDPAMPAAIGARRGGFVEQIDRFDAGFFGMSPREASRVDPQHRLLAETAWEALEDGAQAPERLAGSATGVFVGVSCHDYYDIQISPDDWETIDAHTATGGALSIAANRISYLYDLRGPSLAVDTACSSALVAIHLACKSIDNGECTMALAGGVNVMIAPPFAICLSKLAMLAPDGRCKAFDARANGYVRAEGAGLVLLKPFSRAKADGDRIYALIRGTAVNQDGRTPGITVPSRVAQEAAVKEACRQAGVEPARVGYVEAHGTGTPVGDPIEANALGTALGAGREMPLCIGSVKTNIGHLESAAGAAGLIKVALMLRNRAFVPSLHFEQPNPDIAFDALNLRVPTRLEEWSGSAGARLAGVNSFGFGGTNAHVILADAPPDQAASSAPEQSRALLLALSARSPEALRARARQFVSLLSSPGVDPGAVCETVAVARGQHGHRLAVAARDAAGLSQRLGEWLSTSETTTRSDRIPKVAFVFCGQGAQWWAMARQLIEAEPVFRETVERVDALVYKTAGWRLIKELCASEQSSRVHQTDILQPAVFAVQVGLAALWRGWGVTPVAVVGHSMGEMAAAYVGGALSLEDTLDVVVRRARIQHQASGTGKMLAAALSYAEAEALVRRNEGQLWVAGWNAPESVTLGGEVHTIEQVHAALQAQERFSRIVQVACAAHTPHMDRYQDQLLRELSGIRPRRASATIYSTVTGERIEGTDLGTDYWWSNFRQPVRFEHAVRRMQEDGIDCFVELGPHPVLSSAIAECASKHRRRVLTLPSIRRNEDEVLQMRASLGVLWANAYPVSLEVLEQGHRYAAVPAYPWQRARHWQESEASAKKRLGEPGYPLPGERLQVARPVYERLLDPRRLPWLADHRISGSVVMPGAGYVAATVAVAREVTGSSANGTAGVITLEETEFRKALVVGEGERVTMQWSFEPESSEFEVSSRRDNDPQWTLHSRGRLFVAERATVGSEVLELEAIKARCGRSAGTADFYAKAAARGIELGPAFQGIRQLWHGKLEALGLVEAPTQIAGDASSYPVHPAFLDACFQVLIAAFPDSLRGMYLPVAIKRLRIFGRAERVFCHARIVSEPGRTLEVDLKICDESGHLLLDVCGMRCRRLDERARDALSDSTYGWKWDEASRPALRPAGFGDLSLIATSLADEAVRLSDELAWNEFYSKVEGRLDEVCAAFAGQALRKLGSDAESVAGRHRRALGRIAALAQRLPAAAAADPRAMVEAVRMAHPQYDAECTVISRCGPHLAQILRGEQDVLELIFPPGDKTTAAQLYDDAPVSRLYNILARSALESAIRDRSSSHPLRVLEIGGGTGGLTSHLLDLIPAHEGAEYCFTDVSPVFVGEAQRRFASYAHFRTRLLDIESSPESQGFRLHDYDVVVASNVIHATRDLRQSIGNAKALLAPGGLMMLIELTREVAWLDLVFGLTEGWWRFEDNDLRPAYPLLRREAWAQLLREAGFEQALTISDREGSPAQSVVVARVSAIHDAVSAIAARGPFGIVGSAAGAAGLLDRALRRRGAACASSDSTEGGLRRLLCGELTSGIEPRALVYLDTLDLPSFEDSSCAEVTRLQTRACAGLATLARLTGTAASAGQRLWLVTRGAVRVANEMNRPEAAPVWGIGKVILIEHPELHCRMIDLDPHVPLDPEQLLAEIAGADANEEIALRGGRRLAPKLERLSLPEEVTGAANCRLGVGTPGVLDTLRWQAAPAPLPGESDVEIEVEAVGLNFRDVMIAMGMLPEEAIGAGEAAALGLECAGRVIAVGDAVRDFSIGDEVMGMAWASFARRAIAPTYGLIRKPRSMSFAQAATITGAFLTAHYALIHLARLQEGERVLIHSASGGVGLAAIQVAKRAGAVIFATAGSQEKREYLLSLGVLRAMNSRTLAFADEVLEATNGEGVDVVLNSLAGEAIGKSVSLLRAYGRFVEIGKTDIYRNSSLGLRPFARNLSFMALELVQLYNERPQTISTLMRELEEGLASGELQSLPLTEFPLADVAQAFRHMAQARHIGKIVLAGGAPLTAACAKDGAVQFRRDKTYLVTGGTSGFGLRAAGWLARHGARNLLLVSRSGVASEEAQASVNALRGSGVQVRVERADVSDEDQMAEVFRVARHEMPPLCGVIHAAHIQSNAMLARLDEDAIRAVLAPKVAGAVNLHKLTLDLPLDFFVMFSSAASVYGSFGQASYVAGNAFLDALAHYRTARALPALAVNWGWLGDTGYVSRHEDVSRLVEGQGLRAFRAEDALDLLGRLLSANEVQAAPMLIDWNAWRASAAAIAESPRFEHLTRDAASSGVSEEANLQHSSASQILRAPEGERQGLVEGFLERLLSRTLGTAPGNLHSSSSLSELGVDSLMTVELRERIEREFGVDIPVMQLMQGSSIEQLATRILNEITRTGSRTPVTVPTTFAEIPLRGSRVGPRKAAAHAPTAKPPTFLRRIGRPLCALGLRSLLRVRLEGMENIPPSGPVVLAGNHVNALDAIFLFAFMPNRAATGFAADYLREVPVFGWFMSAMLQSIFVKRGAGDLEAIGRAVDVLERGEALVIAPEGTRSRDGILRTPKTGVAWIALQSGVPVIPVAAFGHEHPERHWKRLRRPVVTIRVGAALKETPRDNTPSELSGYTNLVMRELASLLPEQYRGIYGRDVAASHGHHR